jgi:hypothetical protein
VEASIKVWYSFTGHSAGAGNENVFQVTLPLVTSLGFLESISLGAEEYRKLLGDAGISVTEEYEDVGESHYFDAVKGK